MQGRHRRGNKWRYAAPVLGYSVAAALAVVAATSAHYGQLRSEEVGSSNLADNERTHVEPRRDYLPPISRSADDAGAGALPAPPAAPRLAPPAPTQPANAGPETTSDEPAAQAEPTERSSEPVSVEPAPSETSTPTSEPTPTSQPPETPQPTETSEPAETSEPTESSEPTSEPTEPSTTEEPQPRLLKGVDGVVHGLTDPVLGLLG
ncbi:hypothetical protein [Saccharopolyspora griseoalba]|uniref:Uncharacterized protein n=1 Tax=Saccharopolyspora griseoalba TaxID=1431848 RepID=A0ABW2LGY0_9PSEU